MSYGVVTPPRPKPRRWRKWLFISVGSVVGLIIVLIVVGLTVNTNSPPKYKAPRATGLVHLRFGQKAVLSQDWVSDGIVSATVYSFQTPFKSQTLNTPDAGNQYAVSRVQVCAGPQGANTSNELLPYPFQIEYPARQTFGALDGPDAAKEPDLSNAPATLRANQCVHGYVTFEFTKGKPPLAVGWGSPDQPAYEWTASG